LGGTGPGSPALRGLGVRSVYNFSFHRLSFLPVGFDEKGQFGSHALLKSDPAAIIPKCTAFFTNYVHVAWRGTYLLPFHI